MLKKKVYPVIISLFSFYLKNLKNFIHMSKKEVVKNLTYLNNIYLR